MNNETNATEVVTDRPDWKAADLIREVERELDSEALDRRRAKIKDLLRELRAAQTVVRSLKDKLQEVASGECDVFG